METYTVEKAKCVAETPKAIKVIAPEFFDKQMIPVNAKWIPQSLVHEDSEVWKEGQRGDLVVPVWWAEQEGLL